MQKQNQVYAQICRQKLNATKPQKNVENNKKCYIHTAVKAHLLLNQNPPSKLGFGGGRFDFIGPTLLPCVLTLQKDLYYKYYNELISILSWNIKNNYKIYKFKLLKRKKGIHDFFKMLCFS